MCWIQCSSAHLLTAWNGILVQALFRSVAMIVPNLKFICLGSKLGEKKLRKENIGKTGFEGENMLMSEGFIIARLLAHKFVPGLGSFLTAFDTKRIVKTRVMFRFQVTLYSLSKDEADALGISRISVATFVEETCNCNDTALLKVRRLVSESHCRMLPTFLGVFSMSSYSIVPWRATNDVNVWNSNKIFPNCSWTSLTGMFRSCWANRCTMIGAFELWNLCWDRHNHAQSCPIPIAHMIRTARDIGWHRIHHRWGFHRFQVEAFIFLQKSLYEDPKKA